MSGEALRRLLAWLRRPAIGLALTLAACAMIFGAAPLPLADTIDRLIYDSRLRSQEPQRDQNVVIVDIDERSLAEQGRWPWPRSTLAVLVGRLAEEGRAAVIGLDLVFAEPQREPGQDSALADRLRASPVVLGFYFTSDRGGRTAGTLPSPVMDAESFAYLGHRITLWSGYGANLTDLQAAAGAGGFINPIVDRDGVVRALPLLAEYRGKVYESLVVAMLRRYLGNASILLDNERLILEGPRGRAVLPLSYGLSALVPFGGGGTGTAGGSGASGAPGGGVGAIFGGGQQVAGAQRFQYVSASDVIRGRADPALFRDRIVLIGTSAPGLTDLRATPVHETFAGVEIHATLLAAALQDGNRMIKRRSGQSVAVAVASVAFLGGLLAFALPAAGAVGSVIVSLLAGAGIWLIGAVGWSNFGLAVPVATGVMLVALLAMLNLAAGYLVEGRARRAVAGLFGEYVSPALVERMMGNPARYGRVSSEDRELTILFVDIRGFTRIGETMQPEQLREYINAFLTAMTDVVHRYGGTVDKYIGDAVMAFWGAPVEDPQHADHAVTAALAMLDEVQRLNREFERRGLPLMRVGIGINTGVVRVGDMGSRVRRAYTVIGDAVNLASRFEGLTKEFDASIILGETTMTQARGYGFSELGSALVAGRAEPVRVFTPTSLRPLPASESDIDGDAKDNAGTAGTTGISGKVSRDRLDEGARIRL